jgi:N-acetyl-alpha-D-glucosaminyl L-malate synthase BshA
VEIFARVLKKTDARLVMVGDGSERTSAIYRARCLGVYDRCAFVGKQPRIVDYLCASDVLLLPSETESFGLAALEAMACEVPVIASKVGGLPEVVDDGETGFLAPVGDLDKMAAEAVSLLTNEKMRQAMGRRARESAVSRYDTHKIIPQYVAFYERVLSATS